MFLVLHRIESWSKYLKLSNTDYKTNDQFLNGLIILENISKIIIIQELFLSKFYFLYLRFEN